MSADTPGRDHSVAAHTPIDEREQILAELREANERLLAMGVRMHELAEQAERLRVEAEEANRAKDEFLAALSHELRTPLNAILGWVHILRRTSITPQAADHALEIIERNARVQARLIADLLQVSEIISGKLRLNVEPTDLASLVNGGIDAMRPTAAAKAIRLEAFITPGIPRVLADPVRVQQIIWNLLSNAVKFTPREGQVTVRITRDDSAAEIAVVDSGRGIDADLLPHVFDRFRQGDTPAQRPPGGLGLGLAIVKQLMELHGGSVDGESGGNGSGSCFTLRFPIPG